MALLTTHLRHRSAARSQKSEVSTYHHRLGAVQQIGTFVLPHPHRPHHRRRCHASYSYRHYYRPIFPPTAVESVCGEQNHNAETGDWEAGPNIDFKRGRRVGGPPSLKLLVGEKPMLSPQESEAMLLSRNSSPTMPSSGHAYGRPRISYFHYPSGEMSWAQGTLGAHTSLICANRECSSG